MYPRFMGLAALIVTLAVMIYRRGGHLCRRDVMVNFELRRDRIGRALAGLEVGMGDRSALLAKSHDRRPHGSWYCPSVSSPNPHLLTMITTANLYAAIAIPLGLQMLGTARVNFGPPALPGNRRLHGGPAQPPFRLQPGHDVRGHDCGLRRHRPDSVADDLDRQRIVFFP